MPNDLSPGISQDFTIGYTSDKCTVSFFSVLDPCKALPCENSGVCNRNQKDEADYICVCSARFTGKNCEKGIFYCSDLYISEYNIKNIRIHHK